MFNDSINHCKSCPQCTAITTHTTFQILGIDVMDLPKTQQGNKHVLVIYNYLSKWPCIWVFTISDQRTARIVDIVAKEIIPVCRIPEALLSDCGTNLLSYLMKDFCQLLGIEKLNTTTYHPQCDGLTKGFSRTLKTRYVKKACQPL